MAEVETLGILEEIQALVSDRLQVVSYKWLSRNFLLSSNAAKRLLQEFVEKHGNGLEVVYTLSGWLKNSPSIYHIRLVSGPRLPEAIQEFDGNCSVQVYSVQACIPKDPAALWNVEYVQAEELFRQPPTIDNCLRDNRFCGISNSFIKRNVEGMAVSIASLKPKVAGVAVSSGCNSINQKVTIPQPQKNEVQKLTPKVGLEPSIVVKDFRTESHTSVSHEHAGKPTDKGKVPQLPAQKNKCQNNKSTSGNGVSLANMWGRASAKSKSSSATTETNSFIPNSTASAEAQICAHEAVEAASSDDDCRDVNFKRASNGEGSRKRRVIFDFSDEEDEYKDAVNLASPDPPKRQSVMDKQSSKSSVPTHLDNEERDDNKSQVKKDNVTEKETNQSLKEDSSIVSKGKSSEIFSSDKVDRPISVDNAKAKDKVTDAASTSPKRRKVLKTQIDERGREVTEVVWEGGAETETKADSNSTKKAENAVDNTVNRAPAVKKPPAVGSSAPSNPGGKAGNKKAGNLKDPKQGNIMSFFKKV